MNGYDEIKQHPYFNGLDFNTLAQMKYKVPDEDAFNKHGAFQTEDSDDETKHNSEKILELNKDSSSGNCNGPDNCGELSQYDRHQYDRCCYKKVDINKQVYAGSIKVRRKLFLYKDRFMALLEDGSVFLSKDRHIRCQILMDCKTKITLQKGNRRFEIETKHVHEVIETEEAEIWVNILNSIKNLNNPVCMLKK